MKLSRSTRRYPTQARTLANTYERKLLKLIAGFGKAAAAALEQGLGPARSLEAGPGVDVEALIWDAWGDPSRIVEYQPAGWRELGYYDGYEEWVSEGRVWEDEYIAYDHPRPPRYLEPTSFQIAWFVQQLKVLAEREITAPGTRITQQATLAAFRQGTTFGETVLVTVGISSKLGEGPADARVIDALQARNLTTLEGISSELNKAIIRSLTDGLNAGEGVVKLRKRLMKEVEGIGLNRARLMAHTETMHACNEGAKVRYRQVGIEQVQWLTAKDDRLCDRCAPLDGTVYDIDKAPPCPLHPMCRCTLLPVAGGAR